MGKSIREFKKSLNEIDAEVISEEIKNNSTNPSAQITQKAEKTQEPQAGDSNSFEHNTEKNHNNLT